MKSTACLLCLMMFLASSVFADDAAIADQLRQAGATQIDQDKSGVVTMVFFKDSSKITPKQWGLIGKLTGVKKLTFYNQCSLNDETLPLLLGLSTIEEFTSDGAQLTDQAMASMVKWPNLKKLTFFHTSAKVAFHGTGFEAFTALPKFESFSMGGAQFTNDGMAAIAKLTGMKDLRVWHVKLTPPANVSLESFKELMTIYYAPDARTTAEAPSHLATLPKLEKITLMETRLSAADLAPLKTLEHLKTLTLEKVDISPSDLEAVKASLPKVEVKWTAPDEKALAGIQRAFAEKKN